MISMKSYSMCLVYLTSALGMFKIDETHLFYVEAGIVFIDIQHSIELVCNLFRCSVFWGPLDSSLVF